jgi:hypothetical protein
MKQESVWLMPIKGILIPVRFSGKVVTVGYVTFHSKNLKSNIPNE